MTRGRADRCRWKSSSLFRHVNHIPARRSPKVDPTGLVSPFSLRHAEVVAPAPRCGNELRIVPPRWDPCAVPSAAVIQDKDQSALVTVAWALHEVEVVVHEKHLCWASSVLFMNFDERVDAALIVWLGKVPVEVILPKNARITFVCEDEGVCQELVVNDCTVAHDIMVLDVLRWGHRVAAHVDNGVIGPFDFIGLAHAKCTQWATDGTPS
jgi:hypothetical protein